MSAHLPAEQPAHDAGAAAVRVLESAVELARAEAKLAFTHAQALLVRTTGAVLAVVLAASAAQVALLVLALSPLLLKAHGPSALFVALAPSVCLTGLGLFLTFVALRGLRNGPSASRRQAHE